MGFKICNTICRFVLAISLCKLEDINLVVGGWGQSSTRLNGRLFQIDEDGVEVGGVESFLAYKINASVTVWW